MEHKKTSQSEERNENEPSARRSDPVKNEMKTKSSLGHQNPKTGVSVKDKKFEEHKLRILESTEKSLVKT